MTPTITLVVPILNEAKALPELLEAVKAQTVRPDEVVFVDAGSTDGGPEIIRDWWKREGWPGLGCQVISKPGALPGRGRNAGVRVAKSDWIAFLDAGIDAEPDWLAELVRHLKRSEGQGVFGVCRFLADTPFQRALCALTNGYGRERPVVPASLFRKEVFQTLGFFPEHLRAAEDLVWVASYERHFGGREICRSAIVYYRHYPADWRAAAKKWHMAEYFSVLAGMRSRSQKLIGALLPLLYLGLLSGTDVGLALFLAYLLFRGILDPLRRSRIWPWWGAHATAVAIAIVLGPVLDFAKMLGIFQGWRACLRW